ncbi:MAG: DUF2071 domain-containing protein [Planctomycetota bacterium]
MPPRLDRASTHHRPWPLPERPWALRMRWHDLAFLHWPVPAEALRSHVPDGLELDTFDGSAWLGVVPFRMSGVCPRFTPALPGLSAFPELNLRTYVRAEGKPGVWFFSLDVPNPLAVWVARAGFHLPYNRARMRFRRAGAAIDYTSARREGGREVGFEGSYEPAGDVERSRPGSIDAWLTERYCLYSADRRGRLCRGDIHHEPWPLRPARVELRSNTLAAPLGVRLPDTEPLAHFAGELDVVAWLLERVG